MTVHAAATMTPQNVKITSAVKKHAAYPLKVPSIPSFEITLANVQIE